MPADVRDHRLRVSGELPLDRLSEAAELLLAELDLATAELDVAVVDDARMRELNHSYRGHDRPTDVLAFAQAEGEAIAVGPEPAMSEDGGAVHLGDVVISVETAERQAREGDWSLEEELNRLLVHGLLHLLGYDHEVSPEEAARMLARERELAGALEQAGFGCAGEGPP